METELEFTGKPYPRWKRRFFTIWTGQAISMLGSQMVGFAIIWYLTRETGSATVLSMASLFSILPAVILAPIAGTFVDRNNRKCETSIPTKISPKGICPNSKRAG